MRGLSFRKKVIFSQIILFVLFVLALFPLVERTVTLIVRDSLEEATDDVIHLIDDGHTEEEMIQILQHQEYFYFFRMSLISTERKILYDSYLSRLIGGDFASMAPVSYPDVEEAFQTGEGYSIGESEVFGGKFAYTARRFPFQGRLYVLRAAFPFSQLQELTQNFQIGFLAFSFLALLFFNALIWVLFHRLTIPIRKITEAVLPYQMGKSETIHIDLGKGVATSSEFQRLASTLNSLSEQIGRQIQNLTSERNEKEAILESLGEGVIAVDGSMHVTYINYMGSRMLGISRRTLLGQIFPLAFENANPLLLSRCSQLLSRCQSQNSILTDFLSFEGDRKTYIDLIAAPKAKGSGAIIVLQDKSSHYKVIELGKDFVANASHELRTPITIIKGFAETLQDLPHMSKEMFKGIVEKIVRNCERMEKLIKNLLTLADIENIPESRFKEIDLGLLLDNCMHTLLSLYPQAQFKITKPGKEILISADSDILELALINLLDNAAKYSKESPQITITLESLDLEEVRIIISDQGIGIPPQDIEHIFERFYTVDKAHSRKLGGAGLGLSIVRTIIEKHDGRITVKSTLGVGTIFTIVLPRQRRAKA